MKTIVWFLVVFACMQMTCLADSIATALDRIMTPRALHSIFIDEEEITKSSERRIVVIPREGCADVALRSGFSLSSSCEQVSLEKIRQILKGSSIWLCADSNVEVSRVLPLCADLKLSGTSDVLAVGLIEKRDSALENVYGYLKLSLTGSVVGANVEIDGAGLLTMSGMQPMKMAEFARALKGGTPRPTVVTISPTSSVKWNRVVQAADLMYRMGIYDVRLISVQSKGV